MQENENNSDVDLENNERNSYSTNSDINDPRYLPSNNVIGNNNNNIIDYSPPNQNDEMFLKSKILSIQKEINYRSQTRQELMNKQVILKQELSRMKDKIKSKDGVNYVYQNFFDVYKQNFEQYEEKNNALKKRRDELKKTIEEKDKEIRENKKLRNINKESNVNNDIAFNKLQNELKEKSKLLNQEYIEKEEKIKNKYLLEISNMTKKNRRIKRRK